MSTQTTNIDDPLAVRVEEMDPDAPPALATQGTPVRDEMVQPERATVDLTGADEGTATEPPIPTTVEFEPLVEITTIPMPVREYNALPSSRHCGRT